MLNQCNYVVLDEADRMIDQGYEPQVTFVSFCFVSSFGCSKPEIVKYLCFICPGQEVLLVQED